MGRPNKIAYDVEKEGFPGGALSSFCILLRNLKKCRFQRRIHIIFSTQFCLATIGVCIFVR